MARSKTSFSFNSVLSHIEGGVLIHTVVFLPKEIIAALPEGRVRTEGTLNGVAFALAPQYQKEGGRYFMVSAALRKAAKIKVGDKVDVTFKLVNPAILKLPEELEAVLAQDEKAMKVWSSFTTGLQRSLVHYITSVKNVDSRITRSLQMMEKAKAGLLTTQQRKAGQAAKSWSKGKK